MRTLLLATLLLLSACGKEVVSRSVFVEKAVVDQDMTCDVFDVPAGPIDFSALSSLGQIQVDRLDIPLTTGSFKPFLNTSFSSKLDNFGIDCNATLHIKESNTYTLYLSSDDGSNLFLDKTLVIDNSGDHAPLKKSFSTFLLAGRYPLRINYYNRTGQKQLILSIKKTGSSFEEAAQF